MFIEMTIKQNIATTWTKKSVWKFWKDKYLKITVSKKILETIYLYQVECLVFDFSKILTINCLHYFQGPDENPTKVQKEKKNNVRMKHI